MHRKCFGSNNMPLKRGTMKGRQKGVSVSTCASEYKPSCQDAEWRVCAQSVFWHNEQVSYVGESDGATNPTVSRLLRVSSCYMRRARRQAGGLFVMWYSISHCDVMRWEYVFSWRGRFGETAACQTSWHWRLQQRFFFPPPQLFLYGPLKWADASTLLPSVPSQEYSASLWISLLSLNCHMGGWFAFKEVNLIESLLISN